MNQRNDIILEREQMANEKKKQALELMNGKDAREIAKQLTININHHKHRRDTIIDFNSQTKTVAVIDSRVSADSANRCFVEAVGLNDSRVSADNLNIENEDSVEHKVKIFASPTRIAPLEKQSDGQNKLNKILQLHRDELEVTSYYQPPPVNHCAHFAVTIFTCGLWIPCWVCGCYHCCCEDPCNNKLSTYS